MAALETGPGVVGDFVLFITGTPQYVLRRTIHCNLQRFIRLLLMRSAHLVSESGPLFDRQRVTRDVRRVQMNAAMERPFPTLQCLSRKSVHEIEIEVRKSTRPGAHHRRDRFVLSAWTAKVRQLVISQGFRAKADPCHPPVS